MGRTRRVAVVINLSYQFRHHFDVFAGIERYAQEHGDWECTTNPYIQLSRKQRGEPKFDGVIARASSELAKQAAELNLPIVNVWAGSPAKSVPSVLPDSRGCARMAAEHLLLRGYRQFAMLGFLRHKGTQQALDGFSTVVGEANCPLSTQLIPVTSDETSQGWERFTVRLDKWIATWKTPLGVLVLQDWFCRYVATACLRAGLRIPDDVALIGFGDEPLICTRPDPSLSSVNLGQDRVGYQAAALLDRLMAGEAPPEKTIHIEPGELVIRRSTDSYAVDNPQVRRALRFIAEHSHEGIRVEDVARHVPAAVRSLERHFRAALGRTMNEEIARLRLERATRMLLESDAPVKQLARDSGYSDAKYFHQVFVQAQGISPGEYRRRRK